MRARLIVLLASLALGTQACGGASGETPATSASSGGEGESAASFDPSTLDPAEQERIAANQQGARPEPGAASAGGQGGASAPSEADVLGRSGYGGSGSGSGGGGLLIGGDRDHPVPTCGPQESYLFVARDFVCPGGGANPFGGDASRAAAARRGNVGPHPYSGPRSGDPLSDAHIVDVYEVPCPGGPVEVFVCMYHCRP